jgi:hypothetical protein
MCYVYYPLLTDTRDQDILLIADSPSLLVEQLKGGH